MPTLSLPNSTDEHLLQLMAGDNREAFTELYNRYWDKTFAVAWHRLDDEQEAEEVVQEVFLSIWQRRASLKLTHSLATYLSVAVKYRVINHLDRAYRKQQHLDELAATPADTGDTIMQWLEEKELRQRLDHAIKQLPEKCRIVFLLSRDENKTYAEIAAELGIAQKTVEAHMSKALSSLRQSLGVSLPVLILLLR
ncbi:RNA polymerase sigma-70 factor (ECF subfamily) [Mucilaginibacter gracilis]|uniref:RNA polymerase sigma-70 factor (ECF subfamily) n=1 Tax=Mucilaginibacter gracilis TaxID=423350 RepID=A0A495J1A1_9SPHI|nr:RNA polymerase sigma-70 factor [Mucilaginibacter gracilis]RKR82118.1 RNA polymerase sigma-70 factor (ECF subfamily) [Mucilaginibacter gracilis]